MFKRILAPILVVLVINLLCTTSVAVAQQTSSSTQAAEEIKTKIVQIGTGPTARIELRLTDGRKLRGYISEIEDNHFVVVDERTGATTQIAYQQVQRVKTLSNNASNAKTIGKIAALIAVPILLLLILTPKS